LFFFFFESKNLVSRPVLDRSFSSPATAVSAVIISGGGKRRPKTAAPSSSGTRQNPVRIRRGEGRREGREGREGKEGTEGRKEGMNEGMNEGMKEGRKV
jgi:hypothetical protein